MTPERFVEIFRVAALQAGRVASYLQGQVSVQRKTGEATPESAALTAVDLAAQDVILHQLLAHAPEIAVDAEEETELVQRFTEAKPGAPLVVVDPVDGTLNYTRGSQDYAVMGALLLEGRYEASVVLFPAYGELYTAIRDKGCCIERSGRGPEPLVTPDPAAGVLVSPRVPREVQQRLGARFQPVSVSRCSAVDSSVVALGRARAAVAERRADRRRAIGFLVSREAGGVTLLGERVWQCEDPESLSPALAPSITARSEGEALQLLALVG